MFLKLILEKVCMVKTKRAEPIVQIEIICKEGSKELESVKNYVKYGVPAEAMKVGADLTRRRQDENTFTYVTLGLERAILAKKSILRQRADYDGGELVKDVQLTKLGITGKPRSCSLTEEELGIVRRHNLALPKHPGAYF